MRFQREKKRKGFFSLTPSKAEAHAQWTSLKTHSEQIFETASELFSKAASAPTFPIVHSGFLWCSFLGQFYMSVLSSFSLHESQKLRIIYYVFLFFPRGGAFFKKKFYFVFVLSR